MVFGSIAGEAWKKVHAGEWLYGMRPPAGGKLGDCPVCGSVLEWEPGERLLHDPDRAPLPRVHLSALRDTPARWRGKDVLFRGLLIEHDAFCFLSDSWRNRPKDGSPETDVDMLERLAREQMPRIVARFASPEVRARFEESARKLAPERSRAAWIEADGSFDTDDELRILVINEIASIWPPKD